MYYSRRSTRDYKKYKKTDGVEFTYTKNFNFTQNNTTTPHLSKAEFVQTDWATATGKAHPKNITLLRSRVKRIWLNNMQDQLLKA